MSAVVETDPSGHDAAPSGNLDGFTVVRSDTAEAFMVAPAVPSGLVALVLAAMAVRDGGLMNAFSGFWVVFFVLAFVGYLSALVVGVPAYLLIRTRTRAITPLAATLVGGLVAALPWTVAAVAARAEALLLLAAAAFVLGCIGGFSFSLVRDGLPWRATASEREA